MKCKRTYYVLNVDGLYRAAFRGGVLLYFGIESRIKSLKKLKKTGDRGKNPKTQKKKSKAKQSKAHTNTSCAFKKKMSALKAILLNFFGRLELMDSELIHRNVFVSWRSRKKENDTFQLKKRQVRSH